MTFVGFCVRLILSQLEGLTFLQLLCGDGESSDFSYLVYSQDWADINSCTKVNLIIILTPKRGRVKGRNTSLFILLKYKCDV